MRFLIDIVMYMYYVKDFLVALARKPYVRIILYILLVLLGVALTYIPKLIDGKNQLYQRPRRHSTDLKYILFWHPPKVHSKGHNFVKNVPEYEPGQTMFIRQNCSYINCFITYNKYLLDHQEDYDVIVFDVNDVGPMDVDKIGSARNRHQIYIFRAFEPSEKFPICDRNFDHFFNLTWSYKLNSDIPQPFIDIYNESNVIVGPKKNMTWIEKMRRSDEFNQKLQSKNKSVAWVVYKCKLKMKHETFLNEFSRILEMYNLTLDTIGPCGQIKCRSYLKCQNLVEKNYFFQLVLEEHLSEDYVTNKIISAMEHYTMPIVVGAGDYRNFLPPGSYINAQSFDLYKLGALVDYLMKNPDTYASIFDWKNHYYFKERPKTRICELCDKLNDENLHAQTYAHFRRWWDPEYREVCERIRLLKILNSDM